MTVWEVVRSTPRHVREQLRLAAAMSAALSAMVLTLGALGGGLVAFSSWEPQLPWSDDGNTAVQLASPRADSVAPPPAARRPSAAGASIAPVAAPARVDRRTATASTAQRPRSASGGAIRRLRAGVRHRPHTVAPRPQSLVPGTSDAPAPPALPRQVPRGVPPAAEKPAAEAPQHRAAADKPSKPAAAAPRNRGRTPTGGPSPKPAKETPDKAPKRTVAASRGEQPPQPAPAGRPSKKAAADPPGRNGPRPPTTAPQSNRQAPQGTAHTPHSAPKRSGRPHGKR